MINIVSKTETGRRDDNQDSYLSFYNKFGFLITAIADGMGGHKGGTVASKFVIDHLHNYLDEVDFINKTSEAIQNILLSLIKNIQNDFWIFVKESPEFTDMGTTLNLNLFINDYMYSLNVGDSRTSQFYKNKVIEITEDHNLATLAKKDSNYKQYASYTNLLTSSLGPTKETKIDIFITNITKKGYIIQTSDGIHNSVSELELKKILTSELTLNDKVEAIVDCAYNNGSTDNMTIMVIEYAN